MTSVDPGAVETPIGYLELDRVRANARRVAEYAARHGIGWRPHIKTHKSRAIARIQLEAGARGLTVATLREAEVMATLTSDLLIAYPPVGAAKLERLVSLPADVDLKVALDAREALGPLGAAATGAGRTVGVLVEQDMGLGRVGVQGSDEALALARAVTDTDGLELRGLLFYPGHIRMAEAEQTEHLREVSDRLRETLELLEREGLSCQIVSGGSTPTLWRSHEIEGLTEIRSGSCIFFDREGLEIGVAGARRPRLHRAGDGGEHGRAGPGRRRRRLQGLVQGGPGRGGLRLRAGPPRGPGRRALGGARRSGRPRLRMAA